MNIKMGVLEKKLKEKSEKRLQRSMLTIPDIRNMKDHEIAVFLESVYETLMEYDDRLDKLEKK